MRGGCSLFVLALCACADPPDPPGPPDAPGTFEFRVWANDYTGPDEALEIRVDGVRVDTGDQTLSLATVQFPDYATGLNEGLVVIETVMGGTVLDRCEMRPGACGSYCVPAAESGSVCIDPTGKINLNTYDCPCGGPVSDWFCGGSCSETGP